MLLPFVLQLINTFCPHKLNSASEYGEHFFRICTVPLYSSRFERPERKSNDPRSSDVLLCAPKYDRRDRLALAILRQRGWPSHPLRCSAMTRLIWLLLFALAFLYLPPLLLFYLSSISTIGFYTDLLLIDKL